MSVIEKVKSYVGVYGATDVRTLLHDDHKDIQANLDVMASDEPTPKRVSAFNRLKPLLVAHARAEEVAVYNALVDLKGSADSRQAANEGFVEHSLVDVLLDRLSKTDLAATDAWKAHAKVLKEMLDHHIKEEEGKIFEELGEHFSDEERDRIGTDFDSRKHALLDASTKLRSR
jgi:hemerythrin-like domain-containing protein